MPVSNIIDIIRKPVTFKERVQAGIRRNRDKLRSFVEAVDKKAAQEGFGSPEKILLSPSARRMGLRLDPKISDLQDRHKITFRNQYVKLVNRFAAGKITKFQFTKSSRQMFERAHMKSWTFGLRAFNPSANLEEFDLKEIKKTVDKQMLFAEKMATQIKAKDTTMPIARRAAMYANAADGSFEMAAITRMKDVNIYWRLTARKSCSTCIALATSSPFSAGTLPTVPRAGRTICVTNCKCFLEVKRGKDPAVEVQRRVRAVIGKGGIDFSIESAREVLKSLE